MTRSDSIFRTFKAVAGRIVAVGGWILLNLLALWIARSWSSPLIAIVLVAGISPAYVCIVHWLDRRWKWMGLRSLAAVLPKAHQSGSDFTKHLRLQMLVITSGFAATLFFLSMQLYFDLGSARRPSFVLETMTLLFFLASLLNLLQIVLVDFRFQSTFDREVEASELLRRHLAKKLAVFRDLSWHALVAPVILAFSLIDLRLCIAVNSTYGILLFTYYFLPCGPIVVDHYYKTGVAKPPQPPGGDTPTASSGASGEGR